MNMTAMAPCVATRFAVWLVQLCRWDEHDSDGAMRGDRSSSATACMRLGMNMTAMAPCVATSGDSGTDCRGRDEHDSDGAMRGDRSTLGALALAGRDEHDSDGAMRGDTVIESAPVGTPVDEHDSDGAMRGDFQDVG